MKRSDAFLIPQGSLMSTANTESSQEPWWESPVQTAFSTKNVQTSTSSNTLQMRAGWQSKKILKKLLKKENVCSNVVATTLTKKKTVSEEQSSICEEFWMEENEKNKGGNYGEGKRKNIFFPEVRRG